MTYQQCNNVHYPVLPSKAHIFGGMTSVTWSSWGVGSSLRQEGGTGRGSVHCDYCNPRRVMV